MWGLCQERLLLRGTVFHPDPMGKIISFSLLSLFVSVILVVCLRWVTCPRVPVTCHVSRVQDVLHQLHVAEVLRVPVLGLHPVLLRAQAAAAARDPRHGGRGHGGAGRALPRAAARLPGHLPGVLHRGAPHAGQRERRPGRGRAAAVPRHAPPRRRRQVEDRPAPVPGPDMCRCRSLTPPPAEGPLHPPDGQLVVPSLGVAALTSVPGDVESPADTEEFEWTSVASFPYLATGGEAGDQAEEEDAAVVEVFGGQARRQSIFDISRWVCACAYCY